MQVIVTGATGFVGRYVVSALLARQHTVTAVVRNPETAEQLPWFEQVKFISSDLGKLNRNVREQLGQADLIVHLAWPGLPNYRGLFHFEKNLPEAYSFLSAAIKEGYSRLLVVGTCFEYGRQQGCLREDLNTLPDNPYGLAKDILRKFLELLQHEHPFTLQWCRLFYMFGAGQNPKSLLAQLDAAMERGDDTFPMSGGEQIRDFLPVTEIARRLVQLIEHPEAEGVFNICSGQPISIRKLVENHIREVGGQIKLQLGVYPYPDYEPFAFWGDTSKYSNFEHQL